ncbi:tRNA pseudouridine(38-40) synthase TruA [Alicyclobacillus acidiphilus]|uniref:tRNA pseudouridine(38-40) synthase TruA n=1 Tax=Alicyclobacillus acidiphilus TaxID=182455 RepID=UPI00082E9AFE|nr:tRNA pseudouridine(38-40) synthase TruA [Alicyclobacillus acidiphilus]
MERVTQESRGSRIRLVVAYDGAGFHGFARQRDLRTVQGVLEGTLSTMLATSIEVHGSGRTDKGVHARAQVVHFDQPYGPPPEKLVHVLNRRLPDDIIPIRADAVDLGFHARFSVVRKTYRYALYRGRIRDLFHRPFSWHVPTPLDLDAMRRGAAHLVGTHDFTSFCSGQAPQEDKVRTLYRVEIVEAERMVYVYVEGNGFLQYMVRILVGTLVEIGLGRRAPDDIREILLAKDRARAGSTAPPQGLCLWNVEYPTVYGGKVLDPEWHL